MTLPPKRGETGTCMKFVHSDVRGPKQTGVETCNTEEEIHALMDSVAYDDLKLLEECCLPMNGFLRTAGAHQQ